MIAAGAIHGLAGQDDRVGFSIHTVGIVLMAVGAAGLALSIVFWSSWGGFISRARPDSNTTVIER